MSAGRGWRPLTYRIPERCLARVCPRPQQQAQALQCLGRGVRTRPLHRQEGEQGSAEGGEGGAGGEGGGLAANRERNNLLELP